jgi:hypothetical protein
VATRGVGAPPPHAPAAPTSPQCGQPLLEQLRARQQELDEARRELERKRAQLEREIAASVPRADEHVPWPTTCTDGSWRTTTGPRGSPGLAKTLPTRQPYSRDCLRQ